MHFKRLTVTQLLLIAQTNLACVVHLGANCGILIQVVFSCDSEFGCIRSGCPRQLNASLQAIVATLINAAAEFATIVAVKIRC